MRCTTHRACDLDASLIKELSGLTNDSSRGDWQDDGQPAGSVFKARLNDHLSGFERLTYETWIVIANVVEDEDIAGWSMLTRHDVDPYGKRFAVPTGEVGLYVSPAYRRQRVGSRLIETVSRAARKNGMLQLLALPWNRSSSRFFSREGFIELHGHVPGWVNGLAVKELARASVRGVSRGACEVR